MPSSPTEDTIRRIYRETLDDFYGVVSRRCDGDRDLAEDVVHDTWLRAVRAWQLDGVPEKPMAWLTTVASRLLANHYRRRRPERLEDAGDDAVAVDTVSLDARRERQSLISRALARLPLLQAGLIEAFHYDERPVADIARERGLSERAVEGRLRRARQSLRRAIDTEGGDQT